MKNHLLKVSRLEGLTDGIFAIAMTILVFDLHLPVNITLANMPTYITTTLIEKLFVYVGSFILLGTLWIAMNFQLGLIERVNRPYLWTNVFYLMAVCVVPFSANLLAAYPTSKMSILCYAINLLCVSVGQFVISQCAHYYKLNNADYSPALRSAILQRIGVAPIFYIGSIFMAEWNTKAAFLTLLIPTLIYMIPGKVDKHDR